MPWDFSLVCMWTHWINLTKSNHESSKGSEGVYQGYASAALEIKSPRSPHSPYMCWSTNFTHLHTYFAVFSLCRGMDLQLCCCSGEFQKVFHQIHGEGPLNIVPRRSHFYIEIPIDIYNLYCMVCMCTVCLYWTLTCDLNTAVRNAKLVHSTYTILAIKIHMAKKHTSHIACTQCCPNVAAISPSSRPEMCWKFNT